MDSSAYLHPFHLPLVQGMNPIKMNSQSVHNIVDRLRAHVDWIHSRAELKMKFIHYFLACFSLLFIQTALGDLVCEQLPVGICSFSIASSGNRCVLETYSSGDGNECIAACGVDRKSVGISSDSLLDHRFTAKLCSPQCYQNCPNIVDLYYNLASEEGGVLLPDLCKALRTSSGRAMTSRFLSSGAAFGPATSEAAFGPISSVDCAPPPM
nr:cell wall integrity and stress response component 1 [Ipomoea batatas]